MMLIIHTQTLNPKPFMILTTLNPKPLNPKPLVIVASASQKRLELRQRVVQKPRDGTRLGFSDIPMV